MAIVAGIDEAGYGPVLGPLVVSAAAFEVPDELSDISLWELLSAAVSKKPSRRKSRIAIADSKKLLNRNKANPLEHLERGVLGMLACRADVPDSLRSLLGIVAPDVAAKMKSYPWYAVDDLPLPKDATVIDVQLIGNALKVAMEAASVRFVGIRSECVLVGEYNRHVTATDNKSTALFDVAARLLMRLWSKFPRRRIRIYVDRQGGRTYYLPQLQRVFGGCQFKIVEESDKLSAYRISDSSHLAEIVFFTKGEEKQLPVALASMASKYLRELFMSRFNSFWADRVSSLAPTAGYYTDGNRFYEQIGPVVGEMKLDTSLIYRCR